MKIKSFFAGMLLLLSTAAQADPSTWRFQYRGFYPRGGPAFEPNVTLSGSFTGEDRNRDTLIDASELSALSTDTMEFIGCNGELTIYHYCHVDSFSFSPSSGSLDFYAWFDDYRDNGFAETTIEISPGEYFKHQDRYAHDYFGYFYFFTPDTQFSIERVSPVPAPGQYALLAAGLLGIGAWRRRRA